MLVVDRSQSMLGQAMTDASAAAQAFVGAKTRPRPDRRLRRRPAGRPADGILVGPGRGGLGAARDRGRRGAGHRALRRGRARLAGARGRRQSRPASSSCSPTARRSRATRVSSEAIAAAREARRRRLPDRDRELELPARPAPAPRRRRPAAATPARTARRISAPIYAALAAELRRTWQLTYVTSARPGDRIKVAAGCSKRRVRCARRRRSCGRRARRSCPSRSSRSGPTVTATARRLPASCCAVLFAMRAPLGSRLRRQIAPHLGEPSGSASGDRSRSGSPPRRR